MKILMTNIQLTGFTGSEIFTYTIADMLRKNNFEIVVYSKLIGKLMPLFREIGVNVVNDLTTIRNNNFDVAHVHHNINALEVRYHFRDLPIVFLSHGVLPFLEQPPNIDIGISKFLAVSEEVKDSLVQKSINGKDIKILRNMVDSTKFFPYRKINNFPRKALILSYKIDDKKVEIIIKACKKLKIEYQFVGGRFGVVPQSSLPYYINSADIVFSLGRGVIESMMCGRIPIVYDHLGGDGMVTPDNIKEMMNCNFSGRKYGIEFTDELLVDEICKYRSENGAILRKMALEYFDAKNQIDYLMSIYDEVQQNRPAPMSKPNEELLDFFINSVKEIYIRTFYFARANSMLTEQRTSPPKIILEQKVREIEVLFNKGRIDEAENLTRQILKETPDDLNMINDLAVILWKTGRKYEALKELQKAMEISPGNKDIIWNLGQFMLELGRTSDALTIYKNYLTNHPDDNEVQEALVAFQEFENKAKSSFTDEAPGDKNLKQAIGAL
ncbi:MAG: tetratricopeptide repeat protein [Desulfatiglandales bacterium]